MKHKVKALLAGASAVADCKAARVAWVKATTAAWGEAQERMDERLTAAVEKVSTEEFDRMFEEEDAKVELHRGPVKLAWDRDVWPRELHARGI